MCEHITYFVVKCSTADKLAESIEKGRWAYRDRVQPPQPRDLLISAHRKGKVILIFSITKHHGWHGYCESNFCLSSNESAEQQTKRKAGNTHLLVPVPVDERKDTDNIDLPNSNQGWEYFPITWHVHFQDIPGNKCLSSENTHHLALSDGSPINKSRNWEEVSHDSGKELCLQLDSLKDNLLAEKRHSEATKKVKINPSFFKDEEEEVELKSAASPSCQFEGWHVVIQKVQKELGKVHLACPFGSQRYNCNIPGSDNDIFLVYQAHTTDILGLDPPKQTIKNSDKASVDYTILELQRYCELLVAGDPRCVETLYLRTDQGLVVASEEWKELQTLREIFLTQACLEKYSREAHGTTGLKHIHKWHTNNNMAEELSPRMRKLGYIVIRLLQNARDMVVKQSLDIFRAVDSTERDVLLSVRNGKYSYSQLVELCRRYQDEIENGKDNLNDASPKIKEEVQKWLIECRLSDLKLKAS